MLVTRVMHMSHVKQPCVLRNRLEPDAAFRWLPRQLRISASDSTVTMRCRNIISVVSDPLPAAIDQEAERPPTLQRTNATCALTRPSLSIPSPMLPQVSKAASSTHRLRTCLQPLQCLAESNRLSTRFGVRDRVELQTGFRAGACQRARRHARCLHAWYACCGSRVRLKQFIRARNFVGSCAVRDGSSVYAAWCAVEDNLFERIWCTPQLVQRSRDPPLNLQIVAAERYQCRTSGGGCRNHRAPTPVCMSVPRGLGSARIRFAGGDPFADRIRSARTPATLTCMGTGSEVNSSHLCDTPCFSVRPAQCPLQGVLCVLPWPVMCT